MSTFGDDENSAATRSVLRTAFDCARADLAPLGYAIKSAALPLGQYALVRLADRQVVLSVTASAAIALVITLGSHWAQTSRPAAPAAPPAPPTEVARLQSTDKTDRLDAYVREARAEGGIAGFELASHSSDSAPLVWPLANRVTTGVRVGPNGERMYGIRIAVPVGTPVRAAADGVVDFAGNSSDGYGKKVVVKHGAIETVYAHVSEIMVKKSDKVRKGQLIAKSGQTGYASSPRLYLGILGGGNAVDPIAFFGKAGTVDRCASGNAPCKPRPAPKQATAALNPPAPPANIPAPERVDHL